MSDLHHSDPLLVGAPDHGRVLFAKFEQAADGHSTDQIIFAAINVLVKALRETYGKRTEVENRIDDLFGRLKTSIFRFYDPVTNQRRSTIPFTQRVSLPLIIDKEKLHNVPAKDQ